MDVEMPNEKELEVLTLFYNRFYDLYDEITKQYGDSFRCALKVEEYLKSLYNRGLTKEERTYLTVHIERIR